MRKDLGASARTIDVDPLEIARRPEREVHTGSVLSMALLCTSALVGCTPTTEENGAVSAGAEGESVEEESRSPEIVSSLAVQTTDDAARLVLHVTNHGPDAIRLEFASGQQVDFTVEREGGDLLWQWSEDMLFTQATETVRLAAGETRSFEAAWPVEGRTGDFVATGWITASNRDIRQRAEFSIPSS